MLDVVVVVGNPAKTQRLERNSHYTYAVGFRISG
jgi:hypothetical protein